MAKKATLSYAKAIEELENILSQIRDESVNVDDLSLKVKRAMELIKFCKEKITSTEMEVKQLITIFDKNKD